MAEKHLLVCDVCGKEWDVSTPHFGRIAFIRVTGGIMAADVPYARPRLRVAGDYCGIACLKARICALEEKPCLTNR